jgi:hypothetical protein
LSILFLLVGVTLAATDSAEIRDRVQLADGLFRRSQRHADQQKKNGQTVLHGPLFINRHVR